MNALKRMAAGAAALAAMALLTSPAGAVELPFTYGQGENTEFGTQKKETYEVAFRLEPGFLEGGRVMSLSVPVLSEGISNVRLWLSRRLSVQLVDGRNVTVPDIFSGEAQVAGGMAEVTLSEPYEITGEGLYVGYSFDVDDLDDATKYPLFVSASTASDGFYMRTSRSYREWQNMSLEYNVATELTAVIDYDFEAASVELVSLEDVRSNAGEPLEVPAVIANHGYESVSSIDFDYELGEQKGSVHYELPEALASIYGRRMTVSLPFGVPEVKYNNSLKVTVTKVNGSANADPQPTAGSEVNVITRAATHRVVMEEYTGTWCGFCVKGTAAVERMLSLYPDDFIPVVLHGGSDPMVTLKEFPNEVPGFPHSWIDRAFDCDPYSGLYDDEFFGIEKTFLERRALPAPADIELTAALDEQNNVTVDTSVRFVEIPESGYELAYALLEDGLKGDGPLWKQSNYYAGEKPEKFIPEMERFCNGTGKMDNMVYNEVVVMAPDIMGVAGSVSFESTDVPVKHQYVFASVDNAETIYGQKIVQDLNQLSVVAMLIDTSDGHIANAAKTHVTSPGAVDTVGDDTSAVAVEWYSVDGRRLSAPCGGICLKVTRYADGSIKSERLRVKSETLNLYK